ncbi:hypothetical protein D9M71_527750 [compost metagenome]
MARARRRFPGLSVRRHGNHPADHRPAGDPPGPRPHHRRSRHAGLGDPARHRLQQHHHRLVFRQLRPAQGAARLADQLRRTDHAGSQHQQLVPAAVAAFLLRPWPGWRVGYRLGLHRRDVAGPPPSPCHRLRAQFLPGRRQHRRHGRQGVPAGLADAVPRRRDFHPDSGVLHLAVRSRVAGMESAEGRRSDQRGTGGQGLGAGNLRS